MAHGETTHGESGHKVTSIATYTMVLAALLGCTAITVLMAFVQMPHEYHIIVGLMIATVKATLVIAIFMHLAGVERINALVAAGGLFWLAMLLAFTLMDYATRPKPQEAPNGPTIFRDR
jgi:cytochrome c oxidase subunit 4